MRFSGPAGWIVLPSQLALGSIRDPDSKVIKTLDSDLWPLHTEIHTWNCMPFTHTNN